jgi:hypothetical protein
MGFIDLDLWEALNDCAGRDDLTDEDGQRGGRATRTGSSGSEVRLQERAWVRAQVRLARVQEAEGHLVEAVLPADGEDTTEVGVGGRRGDGGAGDPSDLCGGQPNSMAMLSMSSLIVASIIDTPSTYSWRRGQ